MAKSPDLKPLKLDDLKWTEASYPDSIKKLADTVRVMVEDVISWYVSAKKKKKIGATLIRILAIVSTAAAGILTVLAQYFDGSPVGEFEISPVWISLPVAISAGLIGFDRFFGLSRGWIRYITTELKIRTALNEFNLSWPLRMTEWSGGVPDKTQTQEAIKACTDFHSSVDALVKTETENWATDFEASLKSIEEANKASAQAAQIAADTAEKSRQAAEADRQKKEAAAKPGSLNVTVTNGDQCAGPWTLSIEDGESRKFTGKTGAIASVGPGHVVVVVSGKIGAEDKQASTALKIEPDSVTDCSFTLG